MKLLVVEDSQKVANLVERGLREGDDHRALIHTMRGVGYMMSEEPPDNATL